MKANGEVDMKISVSFNVNKPNERPKSPDFSEGDYVEEENKFLPPPKFFIF